MEWKIDNVQFKLEFSFILILAFVLICGYTDALYVMLFASVHELGHLVALLAVGAKPSRLAIAFFGFSLRYDDVLSKQSEAAVLIAGPAVNLILWFILHDGINSSLFMLNILPIFPLDGGRIARLFLPDGFFKLISAFFLFLLLTAALYMLVVYKSFSLLLITGYLIISGIKL